MKKDLVSVELFVKYLWWLKSDFTWVQKIHVSETDSKWSILKPPFSRMIFFEFDLTEAVVRRCSVNKVFLEISLASAFNFIKKETLAQMFSCEFCEISRNTFSYRTTPVAASDLTKNLGLIHLKVSLIFSTVIEWKK